MAKKNVLIVDDVAELGRMLQAALATISDELVVRVVPSAEEGLLEATRNPVDLMITDIRLPGISGLEFTRRVRQRHKAVKVIQITGMDDASLKQQAMDAGADLFFRKPLAMTEFLIAIEGLLDLKRAVPPSAVKAPPELSGRLKEQITTLRMLLSAQSVGLVDDLGHVLVQDGGFEGHFNTNGALPAVLLALSAGAKVPQALGQSDTEIVMTFKGSLFDLMACSINTNMALLVVFKHGPSRISTAIGFDELVRARLNIIGLLRDKGSLAVSRKPGEKTGPLKSPEAHSTGPMPVEGKTEPPVADDQPVKLVPTVIPADAPVDQKLAADLRTQEKDQSLRAGTADAFWEEAIDKQPASSAPVRQNTLSYEQARKMGMTLPETDKPAA